MNNILEDITPSNGGVSSHKVVYLQRQKERLEIAVTQLLQKNSILRRITEELGKQSQRDLTQHYFQLIRQNEKSYARILSQNQQLSSALLLHNQICEQNQLQFQTVLKTYEDKIIQLRRSIQQKQTSIQTLQSRLSVDDTILTPLNNVTILFFGEIEELKKTINQLTLKNRQLQSQNKNFKQKYEKISKKMQMIDVMTKTKIFFTQFKDILQQKRVRSTPRRQVSVPFERNNKESRVKLNEAYTRSTRQISQEYTEPTDSSLKMLVYKSTLQTSKLKQLLKQTRNNLKNAQNTNSMLVRSYNNQQKRLAGIFNELNYYKKSTQDLVKVIGCRRQYVRGHSSDSQRVQGVLSQIKVPQQITYITDRKKFWKDMQNGIKLDRQRVIRIKKKYLGRMRSLSCLLDYRIFPTDEVDRYLNRKTPMQSNNKVKKMQQPVEKISDFSAIMSEEMGTFDFSVVHSSGGGKKTYSQWKRQSKGKATNLTVIQENIL